MSEGYSEADRRRWAPEEPKAAEDGGSLRSPFARDRARVLHSSALRRLAGKTQVVGPAPEALLRTRLTHSLEVAQLSREIGAALGCDPDVVDTAGLAHDLGHPPFGHNGEAALDAVAEGIGGFEGNAQTLRVLTRLEPKAMLADGRSAGLNLTRASLDATAKYPWARCDRPDGAGPGGMASGGTAKFGVYAADAEAFAWIREGRADGERCLEAQVMDWADDVAYSVHDIEDAVVAGLLDVRRMDDGQRQEVCRVAAALYSPRDATELGAVLGELLAEPFIAGLSGFDGTRQATADLKRATSELIGRFVGAAVSETMRRSPQPAGTALLRYRADLHVPDRISAECALLKAMAMHFVMRRPGADALREAERALLSELVAALAAGAPNGLEPMLREQFDDAPDDDARLRAIIDQVAALTDSAAIAWHRAAGLDSPLARSAS